MPCGCDSRRRWARHIGRNFTRCTQRGANRAPAGVLAMVQHQRQQISAGHTGAPESGRRRRQVGSMHASIRMRPWCRRHHEALGLACAMCATRTRAALRGDLASGVVAASTWTTRRAGRPSGSPRSAVIWRALSVGATTNTTSRTTPSVNSSGSREPPRRRRCGSNGSSDAPASCACPPRGSGHWRVRAGEALRIEQFEHVQRWARARGRRDETLAVVAGLRFSAGQQRRPDPGRCGAATWPASVQP